MKNGAKVRAFYKKPAQALLSACEIFSFAKNSLSPRPAPCHNNQTFYIPAQLPMSSNANKLNNKKY